MRSTSQAQTVKWNHQRDGLSSEAGLAKLLLLRVVYENGKHWAMISGWFGRISDETPYETQAEAQAACIRLARQHLLKAMLALEPATPAATE